MTENIAEITHEEDEIKQLGPEHILEAMPQRYKHKVKVILSHIIRDPSKILAWNDVGELVYKGTTIPGSHIIDLLKDSQYEHKAYHLTGVNTFYRGLEEIHVPKTVLRKFINKREPEQVRTRPPGTPNKKTKPKKKWIAA